MDRSLTEGQFYAAYEVPEPVREAVREATSEALSEAPSTSLEVVGGELAVLTPKSAKELGEIYQVTDKSIQTWFKTVFDAYCWLNPLDLKVGVSNKLRYTPLCQQLLADYRSSGLSADQWIAQVQAENADKLAPPAPASVEVDCPLETEDQSEMMIYQPQVGELERFTPPERKIFKFTSTSAFVDKAKSQTIQSLDTVQANSSALMDSLINQMQSEGQKLGVELFRAKYGTAQSVLTELEQAMAKKSGLVEETAQPPKS